MTFSERLISLQKEKNVTKVELQQAIGISRTAYYRYEQGEREPTVSVLLALADYFDVSVDYLLGRTDNPKVNR